MKRKCFVYILLGSAIGISSSALAANRTVDLTVDYKTVNFTGKPAQALAINGQIPGPMLAFTEGDIITINVHNHLKKPTSIHWHGLILPWQMDGVPRISQPPIPPGSVFHYHFTLKQSGTYWYHAHEEVQEQQGLYGAFIIHPKHEVIRATKDYPMVLSDWSNTPAEQIYANLKKEGDYYSPRFPIQPSLQDFIKRYRNPSERSEVIMNYKMMQSMRMSPYDFSDVAYDAFLLNGHTVQNPWKALVKVGDTVRLRFIDAGANSLFHVKIPGVKLHVVHVQGNNVKPYDTDSLTLAPGETYDILVHITQNQPYIIYVESSDKVGKVYGALVTNVEQPLDISHIPPFPEPKPEMGGHSMAGHDMGSMMGMDHSAMDMKSHDKSAMNHSMMGMDHSTMEMPMTEHTMSMDTTKHAGMDMPNENKTMPAAHAGMSHNMAGMSAHKYQALKATHQTNDPSKPVIPIKMELSGYMERYMWFINGISEHHAKPILLEKGKRYRITFTNNSMMHHPMHIHGHWFILRNGYGAYDPKLHTIDVPPGATITVDMDADAAGQWIFHCHNLYHMQTGMGRIFRYQDATSSAPPVERELLQHTKAHETHWQHDTHLELAGDFAHQSYETSIRTRIGSDEHKLELALEEAEITQGKVEQANLDVFYWHLISEFWAVKGGLNTVYRPAKTPYVQPGIGIEGLMPYFIDTDIKAYAHQGSIKLDMELARDNQLTNNFFIRTAVRGIAATKTVADDEIGNGLNELKWSVRPYYRLSPGINLYTEYSHTQYYGTLKGLMSRAGEATREDAMLVGILWLF